MKLTGFHLEPTNRCMLACSACERTLFQNQFGTRHWRNQDLDITALINFMDQDVQGLDWELCGNTGDPIYHPDLVRLVRWIKQQHGRITMTTNGSYRPGRWWQELLEPMDDQDSVFFSVDGLPATSPRYRVGSDWTSIEKAMRLAAASAVSVTWKMIPFSFNHAEIDQVQQLASDMGLAFRLDPSDRFTPGDPLQPKDTAFSEPRGTGEIVPVCSSGNRHYISAHGKYSPCCWTGAYTFFYKTQFHKQQQDYDISITKLSQVMSRMQGFDQRMMVDPMDVCSYSCRKVVT